MTSKTPLILAGGAIAVALAATGGYWLGQRGASHAPEASGLTTASTGEAAKPARKLLYYRNPMGLPDTSPVPKKDPMGMDYIPVYEGEAEETGSNAIRVSNEKIQKLGVRTEAATMRVLDQTVRAAGRVEIDERRVHTVTPKFEGYVERLHVGFTGQAVRRGQPLFEVYSPELVSAQREYALAAQGVDTLAKAGEATQVAQGGMRELASASLSRLKNWDIPASQIEALKNGGEVRRTLTFTAPANGIVTEKKAVQGMRFMPGDALYQIADLGTVWVVADVAEQDVGQIRNGAKAEVRLSAYPEKTFAGTVSYVYPTLNAATRTVPVRLELPNPEGLLKPAMYAQVELPSGKGKEVLSVPKSAVIDGGSRQNVLVSLGEGRFEPRDVRLGQRGEQHVEILDGVQAGDMVVIAANFLLDSESNLKAALGAFKPGEAKAAGKTVSHRSSGRLESIDKDSAMLEHPPIASLNWPAMTMEFKLANPALLAGIKPGTSVEFEFVERAPGEWVITAIKAASASAMPAPASTAPAAAHSKH